MVHVVERVEILPQSRIQKVGRRMMASIRWLCMKRHLVIEKNERRLLHI